MIRTILLAFAAAAASTTAFADAHSSASVHLGPRPFFLVNQLEDGALKSKLAACTGPFAKSDWSIGHRGAPMQFPEHTVNAGAKVCHWPEQGYTAWRDVRFVPRPAWRSASHGDVAMRGCGQAGLWVELFWNGQSSLG